MSNSQIRKFCLGLSLGLALVRPALGQPNESTLHRVTFHTNPQPVDVYLDSSGNQAYEKFLGRSSAEILLDLAPFQGSSGFTVVFRREGYFDKRERISTGYFDSRSFYPEMGAVSLDPKHWSIPVRGFVGDHKWAFGTTLLIMLTAGLGWGLRRKPQPSPPDLSVADPWLGRLVAGYVLREFVGEGGTSKVYLGVAQDDEKIEVAVKILRSDLQSTDELARRFHREASLYRGLQHGNIVSLVDWGEQDGYHYLITDFIRGESLAHLVFREGALEPALALDYLCQAAQALDYAHGQGIIHRDVKPENLQLSGSGKLKLMDFGLARSSNSSFTQSGQSLGTPSYMSPEQIRAIGVDHRADQYGLGAVGYFLLSGTRPFAGEGDGSAPILFRQLNHDPQPLCELRPGVSQRLSDLVARLMQRDPAKRFQDMQEALKEMKAVSTETTS